MKHKLTILIIGIILLGGCSSDYDVLEEQMKRMEVGGEIRVIYRTNHGSTADMEIEDSYYGNRVFFIKCEPKTSIRNKEWGGLTIGYRWEN